MSDDSRMAYRTERDEWRQRAITAEAERDALLARVETPEAAVEAGAAAIYDVKYPEGSLQRPRGYRFEHLMVTCRTEARAAIEAAKPLLIAQGWTPPGTEPHA